MTANRDANDGRGTLRRVPWPSIETGVSGGFQRDAGGPPVAPGLNRAALCDGAGVAVTGGDFGGKMTGVWACRRCRVT